jgi:hypothetical protein
LLEDYLSNSIPTSVSKLAMQVEFDFITNLAACHSEDALGGKLLFKQWDIGHEAWFITFLKLACVW